MNGELVNIEVIRRIKRAALKTRIIPIEVVKSLSV
jgi:hypothetical protein